MITFMLIIKKTKTVTNNSNYRSPRRHLDRYYVWFSVFVLYLCLYLCNVVTVCNCDFVTNRAILRYEKLVTTTQLYSPVNGRYKI